MVNEFWALGEWLDIWGTPRQDIGKISEEAVRRVQEEGKKAKQAHQQSQQNRQENSKLSDFLTFLIKEIKSEKLIWLLYELFFKTKHKSTGTAYIRKKINIIVIIWFFYPFYVKEAKEIWIDKYFAELLNNEKLELDGYINYIKNLSKKHHDNIPLDSIILTDFLVEIIWHFKIQDISSMDSNWLENFKQKLRDKLYS